MQGDILTLTQQFTQVRDVLLELGKQVVRMTSLLEQQATINKGLNDHIKHLEKRITQIESQLKGGESN